MKNIILLVRKSQILKLMGMNKMSEEIKKGLLGIVVDETTVSQVMPDINSLTYRGYAVQDLCEQCSFEEVAYLLLNKE